MTSLILCKFSFLISAVKLKLGQSFTQFILRFKIGIFKCWSKVQFIYDVHKDGGGVHGDFANSSGWFLGRGIFSLLLGRPQVQKVNLFFPNLQNFLAVFGF